MSNQLHSSMKFYLLLSFYWENVFFPAFCLLDGIWQKKALLFLTILPTELVLLQALARQRGPLLTEHKMSLVDCQEVKNVILKNHTIIFCRKIQENSKEIQENWRTDSKHQIHSLLVMVEFQCFCSSILVCSSLVSWVETRQGKTHHIFNTDSNDFESENPA